MHSYSTYVTAAIQLSQALLVALLWTSCTDNALVSHKYSHMPAKFSFSPVSAYSQLYTACNSMGEWSTIRAEGAQFVFSNPTGSTSVNRTQVQNY